MSSEIRVNQIQNRSGLTTTTLTDTGVTIAGILTVSENLNVGGVLTYEDVTNIDSVGVITARNGIRIGATGANTLITGNGTGIGIGITTPTEELHIRAATPVIRLEDGDNARQSQIVGSDGNLRLDADNNGAIANTNIAFRTDGVERLRIDSAGTVYFRGSSSSDNHRLQIRVNDTDTEFRGSSNSTTNKGFVFYSSNTNASERLRISSDGTLTQTSTKAYQIAKGTTAERPTGVNGMIRYNTSNNVLEGYINGAWVTIKGTGLAEEGRYTSNPQATADDLYAYWDCDSTSTALAGGDSGQATLYGVSSSGGQISNSWDRGTSATNGVYLTSMPTGNNFTLMFWLMLTDNTIHSSSDGAGIVWLDGDTGSGGTEGSVILGYDGSNGNNLRFGGNGWVNDGTVVFSSFGTTNVWRHMTITRDGSGTTWKFYLDGALVNTRTDSMTVGSSWMLGNYNRIRGNGNTNNHYFRGRFDEIAVWDRTLTATEITKVYDTQYAGTGLL